MGFVCEAIPYDSAKQRIQMVRNLEKEYKRKKIWNRIEIDHDIKVIICTYNDGKKLN